MKRTYASYNLGNEPADLRTCGPATGILEVESWKKQKYPRTRVPVSNIPIKIWSFARLLLSLQQKQKGIMGRMGSDVGERVKLYPDGKYRWVYEVPMLTNPSILFDVYKVLGISFFIVWLFGVVVLCCDGEMTLENLWGSTFGFLIVLGVLCVIGVIAYVIVAWCYGWKYVVLFTMDEREVIHQQMPRQMKKAVVLGALTSLMGLATGKPGMVGAGLLAASKNKLSSTLADVSKLVPRRWMNMIKVNQLLNKNRVYVPDEDFDFVYQFLCQHCPKAKRK